MTKQFYKNPEQNAAFARCIDVMTRLIQKYGPTVLEEARKADERFVLPHHKRPRNMKYLQSYHKYLCFRRNKDAAQLNCKNIKLHVV